MNFEKKFRSIGQAVLEIIKFLFYRCDVTRVNSSFSRSVYTIKQGNNLENHVFSWVTINMVGTLGHRIDNCRHFNIFLRNCDVTGGEKGTNSEHARKQAQELFFWNRNLVSARFFQRKSGSNYLTRYLFFWLHLKSA